MLEFYGGTAILLGSLQAGRLSALWRNAVAYFMAHQPQGTWPIQNHGEPAFFYASSSFPCRPMRGRVGIDTKIPEQMNEVIAGGCECGAVRYECAAEPLLMFNCHCRACQQSRAALMCLLIVPPKLSN